MADFVDRAYMFSAGFFVGFATASFGVMLVAQMAKQIEEPAPAAVEPTPADACGPEWRTVPTPHAAAPGTVCCAYTDQRRHNARNIDSWIGPVCFRGGSDVRVE